MAVLALGGNPSFVNALVFLFTLGVVVLFVIASVKVAAAIYCAARPDWRADLIDRSPYARQYLVTLAAAGLSDGDIAENYFAYARGLSGPDLDMALVGQISRYSVRYV